MNKEGSSGYWSVDVPSAQVGHSYNYIFTWNGANLTRLDPAARMVAYSGSTWTSSVIHDARWNTTDTYKLPARNKLCARSHTVVSSLDFISRRVVYELHVPSFNPSAASSTGTFADAIGKLDHLKSLGVTVVELLPTAEFPGSSRGWVHTLCAAPQLSRSISHTNRVTIPAFRW